MWLAVFEGAAWLADAVLDFRYGLLDRLASAEVNAEPIGAADPDWPEGALRVRIPDHGGPPRAPHIIGGVFIDDAWPHGKQDWLEPEELDDRPRLFVLGGSAAFGYPYRYEDSLAVRLQERLPEWQVINVGQVGWTSGQVLGVGRRVAEDWDPAAIVIYTGNNEWMRWRHDYTRTDGTALRRLARSRLLAAAIVGSSLLDDAAPSLPLTGASAALAHPLEDFDAIAWRAGRQRHLAAFEAHLQDMTDLADRTLFVVPPFQYRLQPAFHHPQPVSWVGRADSLVRTAAAQVEQGACDDTESALDEAAEITQESALLHYLRGVCAERAGDLRAAELAYASSREHTVGHLGSRLSINRTIREVGGDVIDGRALFDGWARQRGAGLNEGLLQDDCHPTPRGTEVLADAIATRIPQGRLRSTLQRP